MVKAFQTLGWVLFATISVLPFSQDSPHIPDTWCENKGNNVCRDTEGTLDMACLKKGITFLFSPYTTLHKDALKLGRLSSE